MTEPALQPADEQRGEVDQSLGDAGAVHQLSCQDEEGNGHEGKAVQAGEQALRNQPE